MPSCVTLVIGAELSRWMEVRAERRVKLADLAGYCAGVEHIADRVILAEEGKAEGALDAWVYGGNADRPVQTDLPT